MYRLLLLTLAFTLLPGWTLSGGPAQGLSVGAARDARVPPDDGAKLAFSNDGKFLRAIGKNRAITYAADTGAVASSLNLKPDTQVFSITSDGRTAILEVGAHGDHGQLFLLDTQSGQFQDIPSNWYATSPDLQAAISGDGRLLSFYSVSFSVSTNPPGIVTVYDWPTKKLAVDRVNDSVPARGTSGGGVTVDGAVEFINDRAGRKTVDLMNGGLLAQFSFHSVRSPDGAWVVEFPDLSYDESAPKDVLLKEGANGKTLSKLDVRVADYEQNGSITGAFCGAVGRFVLGRGQLVAVYAIPSGKLLASFPVASWRDPKMDDTDRVSVACSPMGTRVAILSGARLTLHDLK